MLPNQILELPNLLTFLWIDMKKYTLLGWSDEYHQAEWANFDEHRIEFPVVAEATGEMDGDERFPLVELFTAKGEYNFSMCWFRFEPLVDPTIDFPTKLRNEIWPLIKNAQENQYNDFYRESKYNAGCVDGRLATLKEMIKLIERLDCEK